MSSAPSKFVSVVSLLLMSKALFAAELFLPDNPLSIGGGKTALVQLVMQRDKNLFFEAYPSYLDVNGDGVMDHKYKPDEIDYYGYFESNFCYTHRWTTLAAFPPIPGNAGHFIPQYEASAGKTCSGLWSGDFLNYATMTRMDTLRKALYGGKRRLVDFPGFSNLNFLRRAFVPYDVHTWGFEYTSIAVDGYNISDYTPLSLPTGGDRIFFATNSPYMKKEVSGDDEDVRTVQQEPYLLYVEDQPASARIYDWVDRDRAQGLSNEDDNDSVTAGIRVSPNAKMKIDISVCNPAYNNGLIESFCRQYPSGDYRPVGLLQEYGENNSLFFGLMTGSFDNNLQGGVLRQEMASFGENEVDPNTGLFTSHAGIVKAIDNIQIPSNWLARLPNWPVQADCAWKDPTTHRFENNECKAWGNPMAEIMYEGMRYMSGAMSPTPAFVNTSNSPRFDTEMGLEVKPWDDPYDPAKIYGECASAYQLVISEPGVTFDGDQLPGSAFSSFNGSTLGSLNVSQLADTISSNEPGVTGVKFIGEAGGDDNKLPTAKSVTSLSNIRGIVPEAPHREGSYYSASVAYYGHMNDVHPTADGKQTVSNFTLALGSSMPTIDVTVGGNVISFAPFSKSVKAHGADGVYDPNNQIMNFTVVEATPTSGTYRVSFSDTEQGTDMDMDVAANYSYSVANGVVTMRVESTIAAGDAIQHTGYTVSGSTEDGVYLVVRDEDTPENEDIDYLLDVPPGQRPGGTWQDGLPLPLVSTVEFRPSATPSNATLKSPLWYAAKWGGFRDRNENSIPDGNEWDSNSDGMPDNYFTVSNPARMMDALRSVLSQITQETSGAASSVATSAGSLRLSNKIYRAKYSSDGWTGDVISQIINEDGSIEPEIDWSAKDALQAQVLTNKPRHIMTYNPDSRRGVAFKWPANAANPGVNNISASQVLSLRRDPVNDMTDNKGRDRLEYLRGAVNPDFRTRVALLGDVVRSSPVVVTSPFSQYPDNWGGGAPENTAPYSQFRALYKNRQRVVYVGANDGMLHAFNAGQWVNQKYEEGNGEELFAYIPSPGFANLSDLTSPNYGHKHFVDSTPRVSDVFIDGQWRTVLIGGLGRGGQGIYALDVTDPTLITEDNADDFVLWEFTDREDADMGFTYHPPLIARMANGRWNAIFSNGYNSTANGVGYQAGGGNASIMVVDIETGERVAKLQTTNPRCKGIASSPNGMGQPTALDLDGNKIVDIIYSGDIKGCVYRFDVSRSNAASWGNGDIVHEALDVNGNQAPITTAIAAGSHPDNKGIMLYFGTGKYLEPIDQVAKSSAQRIYGLLDRGVKLVAANNGNGNGGSTNGSPTAFLTAVSTRRLLQQTILSEEDRAIDTDEDGANDSTVGIRLTSQKEIDWNIHEGWYMDLVYDMNKGEQVIASPVLRDGKIIFVTHIPTGGQCIPTSEGWLMVLDGRSGAMLDDPTLDLNGDGELNDGLAAGVANAVNPFASPTLVTGEKVDYLLSQNETGSDATSIGLALNISDGRLTWREKQP